MLLRVLTGKAQEAFSALSTSNSLVYGKSKSVMLKAYELVPEAYRQRFRTWDRKGEQMYVEFARDLLSHFKCWLWTSDITTFAELCC